MRKFIIGIAALAVLAGLVWFFGYRDKTQPSRLEAADFAGLADSEVQSVARAVAKLAKATVDGGAPGAVLLVRKGKRMGR